MEETFYNSTPPSFSKIAPAYWNYSDHVMLDDIKVDSNFIWLLISLVLAIIWVSYITFYNSRVIGYIITRLLNRFVIRDGYVKVGKNQVPKKNNYSYNKLLISFFRIIYIMCIKWKNNV